MSGSVRQAWRDGTEMMVKGGVQRNGKTCRSRLEVSYCEPQTDLCQRPTTNARLRSVFNASLEPRLRARSAGKTSSPRALSVSLAPQSTLSPQVNSQRYVTSPPLYRDVRLLHTDASAGCFGSRWRNRVEPSQERCRSGREHKLTGRSSTGPLACLALRLAREDVTSVEQVFADRLLGRV